MKRKSRYSDAPNPSPRSSAANSSPFNYTSLAVIGGVFALGIGVGIVFSTVANPSTGSVVSREEIDRLAPDPELCVQFGASAIVMDTRMFVTLNPFNVYVSQPTMRPGCVLRTNNWSILEQKKLVTSTQVNECKQRMNTFGFTGTLEGSPDIRCIYQNDGAQNFFLKQPGAGAPPSESNNF